MLTRPPKSGKIVTRSHPTRPTGPHDPWTLPHCIKLQKLSQRNAACDTHAQVHHKCTANASQMHRTCTANKKMRRKCTANAPRMHGNCFANAPRMHRECTANTPRMHGNCFANASQMHRECIANAPRRTPEKKSHECLENRRWGGGGGGNGTVDSYDIRMDERIHATRGLDGVGTHVTIIIY